MARTTDIVKRMTGARKRFDRYSHLIYATLLVYAVLVAFGSYRVFTWQYTNRLVSNARVVTSIISTVDVAALSGRPEDMAKPEFRRLYEAISSFLLSDSNIKYAYLFVLRDGKEIAYLNAPEGPLGLDTIPGTVLGETDPKEERFFAKGGSIVFEPYQNPWGTWISVAVPALRDTRTGRVLVAFGYDLAVSSWYARVIAVAFVSIFVLSIGAALVWLGMDRMWKLRRRAELRAEAEREKKLQAEASERAERDFLALMSHEIRNPLSAVVGFSRLLSESKLDPEQRGQVEMLRASSDHLMDLVNDILDFSKIEARQMDIVAQPFAPARVAKEVADVFSFHALRKGLDLRLEADPACPPYVLGDAVRVKQILVNLVSNAVKFTETGRVLIHLGYSPEVDPGVMSLSVEDSGPGMNAETLARLFQPFRQGEAGREKGGTGLGLVISKSLVELMGGRISAGSDLGRGSVFTVELPLPSCAVPVEEVEKEGSMLSGLRILAADDDPANRALVATLLSRRGATVVLAADGDEALAALLAGVSSGSIDAAVIDRSMPGKDGPAVARAVRAAEASFASPPLRLVALTGSVTREGARECLDAGFDVVLPKPFDPDRLAAALLPVAPVQPRVGEAPTETRGESEPPGSRMAAPKAVETDGLIDPAALLVRVEGDAELASVLRDSFIETFSECLSSARAALESGDLPTAAKAAHKLRGSALNACAVPAIADLAAALEAAAEAGDAAGAREALEALVGRYSAPITP